MKNRKSSGASHRKKHLSGYLQHENGPARRGSGIEISKQSELQEQSPQDIRMPGWENNDHGGGVK